MGVSWRKQTLDNCKYISELFAQTGYKQLWDCKIKNQPPSMSQVDFPQTLSLISLDFKKKNYIYIYIYIVKAYTHAHTHTYIYSESVYIYTSLL